MSAPLSEILETIKNLYTSEDSYKIDVNEPEETTDIPEIHRGTVDNPFLYDATVPELEKFLLVNMFVAGKNASVQQIKLDQFINCARRDLGDYVVDTLGILSAIHNTLSLAEVNDKVLEWLKEVKAGQYTRLTNGIVQLATSIGSGAIDLKCCSRVDLVKIKGIGLKTASMFLMYTRRNSQFACLDTHILKYLREEVGTENVPLTTPSVKNEYVRLETIFRDCARQANKPIAVLDFEIWSRYRQKVDAPADVAAQPAAVEALAM